MSENWFGRRIEVTLGKPGHGGFCVARHEGRVMFVRHGLPGERVIARVTEDRGGGFCRADAVEVLDASPDRIAPVCPIAGPGGSGCCDYSHATPSAQREMKSAVVAEQLWRLARVERAVEVEELPGGAPDGTGWRSRVRLAVDEAGRPGYRRFRSRSIETELACPQIESRAYAGLADRHWKPDSELQVVLDANGDRHVVEIAPPKVSRTGRRSPGRRGAMARRAAVGGPRSERVVEGTGRPVERVGGRSWQLDATGFWQAHRGAAETYARVVGEWAQAPEGALAWDLYGGVGVFASVLAGEVGGRGLVESVDSSRSAIVDAEIALADLPQVRLRGARVERALAALASPPEVVVLDPPRAGAGRDVITGVAMSGAGRVIHIGCDPASFGRDVGFYLQYGYRLERLRAFDAFPLTHHVECIALLTR